MADAQQRASSKGRHSCRLRVLVGLLVALLAAVGVFLWVGLRDFRPRTVDLATVSRLTNLSFPPDAELVNSHYQEMPFGSLYACVRMHPDDFETFAAEGIPAAEWYSGRDSVKPSGAGGLPWWRPLSLTSPRSAYYMIPRYNYVPGHGTIRAKSRMVRVFLPASPSQPSYIYVCAIAD